MISRKINLGSRLKKHNFIFHLGSMNKGSLGTHWCSKYGSNLSRENNASKGFI